MPSSWKRPLSVGPGECAAPNVPRAKPSGLVRRPSYSLTMSSIRCIRGPAIAGLQPRAPRSQRAGVVRASKANHLERVASVSHRCYRNPANTARETDGRGDQPRGPASRRYRAQERP